MPIPRFSTPSTLRLCLAAAALALAPTPVFAQQSDGLHARVTYLPSKSFIYIPKGIASPAPLIVLLHGAGGEAREFVEQFELDANARGVVLLSVKSSGRTWAQRKPKDDEADVANIKAAILALNGKVTIDPARTTVMGFSDGASYALSVGMAYPELFRTIVAFSPGYAFAPSRLETEQRIFIAHSRRDPILPADNTRRMIQGLEHAGFKPEVHWFNGGHEIDPQVKKAAFDFALAP